MPRTIYAADAFCGAGGTSTGLARALEDLGIKNVRLVAINHWKRALETHALNHPWAEHVDSNFQNVRPLEKFPKGRLDLLVASPTCVYYSTARGGRPVTNQLRADPWHLIPWLEELRVENLLVENVPEIVNWGPVGRNGKPIRRERGVYFRNWIRAIEAHDYTVSWRKDVCSADFGDATSRTRFYLMARRGRKPVTWPVPTHSQGGRVPGTKPWKAAREIIDATLKGKTIFGRPLALNTHLRIIEGCRRFGTIELEPFLQEMERQLGVQTPPRWKDRRGPSAPGTNPFLIEMEHGGRTRSLDSPLPTITTARGGSMAVAEPQPFTVGVCGRNLEPYSVEDPLPTLTHRNTRWLVKPFTFSTERGLTNRARPKSLDEPIDTVVGSKRRIGYAEPFVLSQGAGGAPRDLGSPLPTIPGKGAHALVDAGFVLPPEGIHRGNAPRSVDDPLATLTQRGGGHFCEPFLARTGYHPSNGRMGAAPRSTEEPLATILAQSEGLGLFEPFLVPNFGERPTQAPRTHSLSAPLPSVTSHGAGAIAEPFLTTYYGHGGVTSVATPMPTQTAKDRVALIEPIVIDGRMLDILFRMLEPSELAAAMSFPKDYQFAGNRTEIVKQIGNAVSVETARWLCRSLLDTAPRPSILEMG